MGCCCRACGLVWGFLCRGLGIGSARDIAATAPLVGVEGFIEQGVHDRPGDIGVTGGVGARSAVGDLAASGGAALDGQERLGDISPAGIPLDAAALDRVLRLEDQRVFRFQAVVNRRCPWVEITYQFEYAIADAGYIDANVLHVEALGEFLDFTRLEFERLPPPAVFLQDAEFRAGFQRWRNDHAGGVVAGAAGVVADPDRAVAEWSRVVGVVVRPKRQIGIAALQVSQGKGALRAVDELAHEQLLKLVLVVLQLQLLKVEQVTAAGDGVEDRNDLAPLPVRAQHARCGLDLTGPRILGILAFAVAEFLACPERVGLM